MLISYPLISQISASHLEAMLALSSGALVYVGATHLLPMAETEHRKYSLIALVMVLLSPQQLFLRIRKKV